MKIKSIMEGRMNVFKKLKKKLMITQVEIKMGGRHGEVLESLHCQTMIKDLNYHNFKTSKQKYKLV